MKILMLVDNYPPEMNANARIFSELAEILATEKIDTAVITSQPNFPQGKLFPGYKNQWRYKNIENGVEVIRVKTYMYPNKGKLRRAIDFFSFGLSSFFFGLFEKNFDYIIGVTPQFFAALAACCLALVKKKPFVMILCDLWPDSIASNKMINKKLAFKFLKKIELFMYKKAKLIAILSPNFRQYLKDYHIDETKIKDFISGPSANFLAKNTEKKQELKSKYNIENQIVIGYIGTFGISHNHDELIEIFSQLRRQDVRLLLIGDGAKKQELINLINKHQLSNITIDGPIPVNDCPDYWALCHVSIIPLIATEMNQTVIPSKILESMKIGLPTILYTPQGEVTRFFAPSNAIWHIESGDKKALKEFIENLSIEAIFQKKEHALSFAKQFSRENQVHILKDYLYKVYNEEKDHEKP